MTGRPDTGTISVKIFLALFGCLAVVQGDKSAATKSLVLAYHDQWVFLVGKNDVFVSAQPVARE